MKIIEALERYRTATVNKESHFYIEKVMGSLEVLHKSDPEFSFPNNDSVDIGIINALAADTWEEYIVPSPTVKDRIIELIDNLKCVFVSVAQSKLPAVEIPSIEPLPVGYKDKLDLIKFMMDEFNIAIEKIKKMQIAAFEEVEDFKEIEKIN